MRQYQQGEWHVFEAQTTKSFDQFKRDATRGLMQGLPGLLTTQEWRGQTCYISSPGAESKLRFDHGRILCYVRINSLAAIFFQGKILSDIGNTTRDVSGEIDETNKDVFIVHGHNEEKKTELKLFLTRLGLHPIVLSEEDDRGMTIIEKFEYYASTCAFAFVLMTPDDQTMDTDEVDAKWRARQNVVLELGWFMARLGRERVVILYQGELEIPSDILGVVYLKFQANVLEISERIRQRLRSVTLIGE